MLQKHSLRLEKFNFLNVKDNKLIFSIWFVNRVPWDNIIFKASFACNIPIVPGTIPKTPISEQLGEFSLEEPLNIGIDNMHYYYN